MKIHIPRLLLGISASSAALSILPELARLKGNVIGDIDCIMTPNAAGLLSPLLVGSVLSTPAYSSFAELAKDGRSFTSLAATADALLVAPATANTLIGLSLGLANNLLTSCVSAFDGPVALLPAVNEGASAKPAFRRAIESLRSDGFILPAEEAAAASDLQGAALTGVSKFGLRRLIVVLSAQVRREQVEHSAR
ncbi:flavoprotein [Leucobacter luti]|uniref:flavoprotein n=1 Tax=Leucobacter luti TaxID=340320 RepID=UPI00104DD898|nr:phosphopantothenoylcysteine synthetase/decarboxylase [Leucobacter luti]TCK41349.1 flavoprotein [Leucobacter luti]